MKKLLLILLCVSSVFANYKASPNDVGTVHHELYFVHNLEIPESSLAEVALYMSHIFFSPIPVYIMDRHDFDRNYLAKVGSPYSGNTENLVGMLVFNKTIKDKPKIFMYLQDVDLYYVFGTYLHELKHYQCWRDAHGCFSNMLKCEIEATEYELKTLKELGCDKALKYSLISLENLTDTLSLDNMYVSVVVETSKRAIWKDCIFYLENKYGRPAYE